MLEKTDPLFRGREIISSVRIALELETGIAKVEKNAQLVVAYMNVIDDLTFMFSENLAYRF